MDNRYLNILFVFCLAFFQSCAPVSVNPDEFISYCGNEENGLIQKRTFNNISYSLKYEPIEYKAINELNDTHLAISKQNFDSLKKEYEGLVYIVFKIENTGSNKSPVKSIARTEQDLSKLTQYCQSNLSNDFYLESGDRKIPAVIFHIEDDYSLSNFNLMSMAFDSKQIDADKDLVFVHNDPFFNNGPIKFSISKETIKKLPKINI